MPTTANLSITYPTPLDPATADIWGDILNDMIIDFDAQFAVRTINQDFADYILSRAKQKDCSLSYYDKGNVSGNITLDYNDGHVQRIVLTGNTTITAINNPPPSGDVGVMQLRIIQDGTGSRTLSYSITIDWGDFGTPAITTTANRGDIHVLQTRTGTNYHGAISGTGYSNL